MATHGCGLGSQRAIGSFESARRWPRGDEKRGCGSVVGTMKTEGSGSVGDGGSSTRTAAGKLGRELEICCARHGGGKSAKRKHSSERVAAGKGQAAVRRRRRVTLTGMGAGSVGCKREEDEGGRQRVNEAGSSRALARRVCSRSRTDWWWRAFRGCPRGMPTGNAQGECPSTVAQTPRGVCKV